MKNVIYNQVALSQPLVGPLAVHIAPFAEWVNSKGYLARYTHRIASRSVINASSTFTTTTSCLPTKTIGIISQRPCRWIIVSLSAGS